MHALCAQQRDDKVKKKHRGMGREISCIALDEGQSVVMWQKRRRAMKRQSAITYWLVSLQ